MTNKGDFQKLQSQYYWSGTENASYYNNMWDFGFNVGNQGYGEYWLNYGYGLAVRPGDVAVVPEPISSVLFISGGTLSAGRSYLKRRKKA